MLLLLLALLLPLAPSALAPSALAPADTTDDRPGVEIGFRIIPSAFYSPTKGFGVGGGIALGNLVAPGTELIVTAQAMQRFGRYRASFFTRDPYENSPYAAVTGEYETNQVYRFFGLGPRTSGGDNLFVDLAQTEAALRVGWYPLGPVLLQPVVRLFHSNVRSFRDRDAGAFLRLDDASQRTLFESVGTPTQGLSYGLEVAYDTRDHVSYTSRGLLLALTGRRYDGFGDDAFRYYAGTTSLYGYVPLPARRHVLYGRAIVALTRRIGDDELPFYALPVLDDDLIDGYDSGRFHGNDLVALTLGYRFPVFTLLDWFSFDGSITASAANAYDDVFEQFTPGITFGTDLSNEGDRVRLRPAAALGLEFVNIEDNRAIIGGEVGLSPEGLKFSTIRFVYEIRDRYPVVR